MIYVEGPDRCGKSTVIEVIRKFTQWPAVHHTNPHKLDPPVKPYDYFAKTLLEVGPDSILDRGPWSEDVYGCTFRGTPGLSDHEFRLLDLAMMANRTLTIVMNDEPDAIRQRWSSAEMFGPELVHELVRRFDELVEGEGRSRLIGEEASLPQLVETVDGEEVMTVALGELVRSNMQWLVETSRVPDVRRGIGRTEPGGFAVVGLPSDLGDEGLAWSADRNVPRAMWSAIDELGVDWTRGYYAVNGPWLAGALDQIAPDIIVVAGPVSTLDEGIQIEWEGAIWAMPENVTANGLRSRMAEGLSTWMK